jgi:hypothetical protein
MKHSGSTSSFVLEAGLLASALAVLATLAVAAYFVSTAARKQPGYFYYTTR